MKELISIVVPVYNIERYIEQCVLSICGQTYKNIEIILIDDGSTDGSGNICDNLAERDQRIKVIHKKHGGLATARRDGVNSAKGKYIGFVDGDDWIESDMYESLYNFAVENDAQMVTSAGYREYPSGRGGGILKDGLPQGLYDMADADNLLIRNIFPMGFAKKYYLNGAVWNKLYEKNIITEVINNMEDNFIFFEDNVLNIGAVAKAKRIFIQHDVYYHHRERTDSITYRSDVHSFEHMTKAYFYFQKIINESNYKKIWQKQLDEYIICSNFECLQTFLGDKYIVSKYVFPMNLIPTGSKVIIYGAGIVGKGYKSWADETGFCKVVKWVDKYVSSENHGVCGVESVESIPLVDFDYIVIAVKNKGVAQEIIEDLKQYQIDREKIVWEYPSSIAEFFVRENKMGSKELFD